MVRDTFAVCAVVLVWSSAVFSAAQRQTAKPATGVDPCALLTRQEAAAAVGEAVGEGKSTVVDMRGNPGIEAGGSCAFESSSNVHGLKLNMYVYPAPIVEALRKRAAQKEQVAGLGDAAWWYDANHRELQVLKGRTSLSITLTRSGDAAEALKTVAKKALDRLR